MKRLLLSLIFMLFSILSFSQGKDYTFISDRYVSIGDTLNHPYPMVFIFTSTGVGQDYHLNVGVSGQPLIVEKHIYKRVDYSNTHAMFLTWFCTDNVCYNNTFNLSIKDGTVISIEQASSYQNLYVLNLRL